MAKISKNQPKSNKMLAGGSIFALGAVVAAGFLISGHPYFSWEEIPGFYPLLGFLSSVGLITVSKVLGKLMLQKKEDYYD